MSLSKHIDNKKRDILIFSITRTLGLDDTKLSADAQYSINFSRSDIKFCLFKSSL